jgi:hypothetical protein
MEFNVTNSDMELQRMYHANQISFTDYLIQHKMLWRTYGNFEMEPDHVVNRKTFETNGNGQSYADSLNSLERRQSDDARKTPRRQSFM